MISTYNYTEIVNAYQKIGIRKGSTVSLKTDLRWLGPFNGDDQREILQAHFSALSEIIDLSAGTLVFPTGSPSLCNTDTVFDLAHTPSEVGLLTEFIRKQPGVVRSFHPFISYTAIGKDAEKICQNVSRHAFGPETPHKRLVDHNALEVSIGLHPIYSCTLVHHVELVMGVPYRYVKEFKHPVMRDGKICMEPFYMYVWYRECNVEKDENNKIFKHFKDCGHKIDEAKLGRGKIYAYSLKEFYNSTIQLFKTDIFAWLKSEPEVKPYRE